MVGPGEGRQVDAGDGVNWPSTGWLSPHSFQTVYEAVGIGQVVLFVNTSAFERQQELETTWRKLNLD